MSDFEEPLYLGYLRVGDTDIPILNCKSWRVNGVLPECTKGLGLEHCQTCQSRESRQGNLASPPIRVRMPVGEPAPAAPSESPAPMRGLGDAIAAVTKAVGIQPCSSCAKRQAMLNRVVPFRRENLAANPPSEAQGEPAQDSPPPVNP